MVSCWLSVCLSVVCPSVGPYFRFGMIIWVNVNGFSPNLVCALILWRSDLGMLMSKFCQFLTELSARDMSGFSFLDDNLSRYQWIFTKLGTCVCALILWRSGLGLQMDKLYRFLTIICPWHNNGGVLSFHVFSSPELCSGWATVIAFCPSSVCLSVCQHIRQVHSEVSVCIDVCLFRGICGVKNW